MRLGLQRAPRERPEDGSPAALPSPEPRVFVAFGAALLTGLLAWVALSYHGWTHHAPRQNDTTVGPVGLDLAGLLTQVDSLHQPVYWVGPQSGVTYELKRTADGSIFLRYLPRGVDVGAQGPFRTVGTYPVAGAYTVTHALAQESDRVWFSVPHGGIAVYRRTRPTNVYLAWPGFDYQVEVYDPVSATAKRLAASTQLRRLG